MTMMIVPATRKQLSSVCVCVCVCVWGGEGGGGGGLTWARARLAAIRARMAIPALEPRRMSFRGAFASTMDASGTSTRPLGKVSRPSPACVERQDIIVMKSLPWVDPLMSIRIQAFMILSILGYRNPRRHFSGTCSCMWTLNRSEGC